MTFEDFWAVWPYRRSRIKAMKAFEKLKDEEKESAVKDAARWCKLWREENPQATHILPASYLNQKRFLDMEEVRESEETEVIQERVRNLRADQIKSGKPYLCAHITPSQARELIDLNKVTEQQCREVCVL